MEKNSKNDTHLFEEGYTTSNRYEITDHVYTGFIDTFEDRSPIHVQLEYAQRCGFPGKVMHGTILNGFLSHFIGMVFPGERALFLSADLRYLHPCYLGDKLDLIAKVVQVVKTHGVLVLLVSFTRMTDALVVANGRIQVQVRDE